MAVYPGDSHVYVFMHVCKSKIPKGILFSLSAHPNFKVSFPKAKIINSAQISAVTDCPESVHLS